MRRQDLYPGGGKLDGKWEPVQAATNVGNRWSILRCEDEALLHRLRPLDEEPHRRGLRQFLERRQLVESGQRQRQQWNLVLPSHTEWLATGGEDGHAGIGRQEPDDL